MKEQRVPLPTDFIRVQLHDPSEASLVTRLLTEVADHLAEDELAVLDAGFALKEWFAVGMERFLVRLATNATARRNTLPDYQGRGRPPEWGEKIRPLPRRYQGKLIEATSPDREESWQIESKGKSVSLKAQFWDNLVLSDQKPGADSFNLVAIHDPSYHHPLLLATSLKLDGETCKALYEGIKPIIGVEAYMAARGMAYRDPKLDRSSYHLLLLAENETGYKNLLRISSAAQLDGFYYYPRIDRDFLAAHSEGIICTSGCMSAEIPRALLNEQLR